MMFVIEDTNPWIGGTGIIETLDKGIYTGAREFVGHQAFSEL